MEGAFSAVRSPVSQKPRCSHSAGETSVRSAVLCDRGEGSGLDGGLPEQAVSRRRQTVNTSALETNQSLLYILFLLSLNNTWKNVKSILAQELTKMGRGEGGGRLGGSVS